MMWFWIRTAMPGPDRCPAIVCFGWIPKPGGSPSISFPGRRTSGEFLWTIRACRPLSGLAATTAPPSLNWSRWIRATPIIWRLDRQGAEAQQSALEAFDLSAGPGSGMRLNIPRKSWPPATWRFAPLEGSVNLRLAALRMLRHQGAKSAKELLDLDL